MPWPYMARLVTDKQGEHTPEIKSENESWL